MKCKLRTWRLSDAKELADILSNIRIHNNLRDGLPVPYTEQDAAEYITAMLSANSNETFAYAITAEDQVIGSIGAFRQGNIHFRTAELGYYLAEAYWGQGIMTDAIRQICGLIFETTDILRIYAEPFAYNIGSCRALEKAGFACEGTMKHHAVKNGKVLDAKLYACTRSTRPYMVKRLAPEQLPQVTSLAWEVFNRFEAPVYSEEGITEFKKTLDDWETISRMACYGAFLDDTLVGLLAMRKPQHISLFFVKEQYHRQGIGSLLFDAMRQDYTTQVFTVNSSLYAVPVYAHLGFIPIDTEQVTNGIRYTPMRFGQGG